MNGRAVEIVEERAGGCVVGCAAQDEMTLHPDARRERRRYSAVVRANAAYSQHRVRASACACANMYSSLRTLFPPKPAPE
jgi:hypothetical protein